MLMDLRSDTVTQPTEAMRQAMSAAPVGDDVYGDDPTVNELELLAAELTGKEAALFVASGTMGNQLAIMTHTRRGDEILCDEQCHIVQHEVGAAAVLSGVMVRTVPSEQGRMDTEAVRRGIRPDDIHYPPTTLLCVENAHGLGTVLPLSYMKEMHDIAVEHGLKTHLDGARLFNAATALACEAKDIARHTDSVTFCLSKGLCAPVGSILCGTGEFIVRARKNRKLLGGGMRQVGILAAAGLLALRDMTKRLNNDHTNARLLENLLSEIPGVTVQHGDINMVFFNIADTGVSSRVLHEGLLNAGIRQNEGEPDGTVRFVTHHGLYEQDVRNAANLTRMILCRS